MLHGHTLWLVFSLPLPLDRVVGWPPSPPKPAQEAAWRVLCGLSDKKGPRGNSESVIMQKKPGDLDT